MAPGYVALEAQTPIAFVGPMGQIGIPPKLNSNSRTAARFFGDFVADGRPMMGGNAGGIKTAA